MTLSRPPIPALRPFVELIWASEAVQPSRPVFSRVGPSAAPSVAQAIAGPRRELVLPTGALHIVVRLGATPLRVFRDPGDATGVEISTAVIGGARMAAYVKDLSRPAATVGALLRPGAAGLLIGAPAGLFSGAHTALADVWGAAAVGELRERLAEAASPARRLALFEATLLSRLPRPAGIDPRVAHALAGFGVGQPVAVMARELEVSHRHFTALFRAATGLAPKSWCRIQRFGDALGRLAKEPQISNAELAAAAGYADQAHLTREFGAITGLTPGDYRRRSPAAPRHVPL